MAYRRLARLTQDSNRILNRSMKEFLLLGFVTSYTRNKENNLVAAFRDFRAAFNIEFDEMSDKRCYYLLSEMSDEFRKYCRTQIKQNEG